MEMIKNYFFGNFFEIFLQFKNKRNKKMKNYFKIADKDIRCAVCLRCKG